MTPAEIVREVLARSTIHEGSIGWFAVMKAAQMASQSAYEDAANIVLGTRYSSSSLTDILRQATAAIRARAKEVSHDSA